ncbi:MAG: acyltransferase, partial [Acidimicrobiales bacterium]|nr:acyltransferase [Acidimicrobiales bacterium]
MTTVPRSAAAGAPATTSTDPTDSMTTHPEAPARVRIPHAPGLDGLRGLAVVAVLVFHAGPAGWLPGGFLGVSLFFTLSGYLITALALTEVSRDRTLHLAA